MKISTQLIKGMVVFVLLLAVISGLVITTNQQVERISTQEKTANEIALEVGELGYLSNDYILYREPQQVQRWNAKYSSISDNIGALSVDSPEQNAIAVNLRTNLLNTKAVFDDIVSSPAQPGGTDTGFIQLSWSRMAVQNQGMVFDAGRLASLMGAQADELRQTRTYLIFALIGAFVAFLLTSYFLFSRRTLKSIAELQEGARIVGSGDLGYTIEEKGDDEISDLTRSFNQMTSDLQHVTATKEDLEREIAGRKYAEEELVRANERLTRSEQDLLRQNTDLNALNEELAATQEELQQNVDELTRSEQELVRLGQQRQLALDSARMGWWHYDPETGISSWDDRYRDIFAVSGNESPNDEIIASRMHPDDLPGVREKVEAALDPVDPKPYSADYRIKLPDGSVRWIETHGVATFEGPPDNRRATGLVGTVTDITDRREAEEALQTTLQRLRALVSNMQVGILLVGEERIELANKTFCDYFGLTESPEDLVGLPAGELIGLIRGEYLHPDEEVRRISEIVSRGQPVTGEEITMSGGRLFLRDFIPVSVMGRSYGRLWYHVDITARKQAEDKLKWLSQLPEQNPNPVLRISPDGDLLFANSPAEVWLTTMGWYAGGSLPEQVYSLVSQAFVQHRPIQSEISNLENETFWISAVQPPGEDYVNLYCRDITERKEAEEALRNSQAKLHAALDSMTDAVFISDTEGRFIDFNTAFATFHRFPNKEVCLKTLTEYPDILDVFMADGTLAPLDMWAVPRALRGETSTNVEYTLRRRDTGETWVGSYSFGPILDGRGAIVGSVVVGRDITDLKKVEEERRKQNEALAIAYEEQVAIEEELTQSNIDLVHSQRDLQETTDYLENLITYANAPIIVWNPDMHITRFNHAFERLTGLEAGEVIGHRLDLLFPEEFRTEAMNLLERTMAGERLETVELPIRGPAGDTRVVLWNSASLFEPDGRTIRAVIAQGQDITERKRAEERLRQYAAHLAQSNKELEQFAYVASHDLREPLRMVTIYAQLLEKNYRSRLDDDADEFIHYIVDGGTRMAALVDDLLEYSRVTSKARPFEPTDMNLVVGDAMKNLSAALEESGGVVKVGQLPKVIADRSQMTQVFQNLIGNAIKFSGGGTPIVEIGAKPGDGSYLFWVRDNGIGIDPAYFGKIFEIFQRLHTREEYEGTGIGLAICRRIVERHGGRIWVESGNHSGSTFYFTIPAGGRPQDDYIAGR